MLKVVKQQTVSLEGANGAVMLSLSDGEGHVFRQALGAHDVGKLLALLLTRGKDVILCQGDLVAKASGSLHLVWHDENGGDGHVRFDISGEMVFEEALKSYCRMLMRSPEDLP